MSPEDVLEVEASTVDEAIREALQKLGAEEDDVAIEVLSTPRSGLLGLGSRMARVRVRRNLAQGARSEAASPSARRPPLPPDAPEDRLAEDQPQRSPAALEEQGREAIAIVSQLLELMGERAQVVLGPIAGDGIEVEIKGDGSGILIGRHGQTLDAIEYLVNRLLARKVRDAAPIVIDTEAYRARRRQQLERMALAMGERAKREHRSVALDPMPPRDRRVIHLALKDDPLIVTRSTGTGYLRALEIAPVEGRRERSERREGPREREPIGQQGGFKHGQKRIV